MNVRPPILATVGVPFDAEPLSAEHQRELEIIRARELGILREELTALCSHMEYLRSWYDFYENDIRAMNKRAAGSAHDHFVDGVIFARSIARAANLDIDRERIEAHDWAASTLPAVPDGPPLPFEYLGGDLGFSVDAPSIRVRALHVEGDMPLEEVLHQIEYFAEPGKTKLLLLVGLHFGVTMNRGDA